MINVPKCSQNASCDFFGSIQEDRHIVEQFRNLWNSSAICGTVTQFVEQLRNLWNSLKLEQVLKAGHCSSNYETVPRFVEQ